MAQEPRTAAFTESASERLLQPNRDGHLDLENRRKERQYAQIDCIRVQGFIGFEIGPYMVGARLWDMLWYSCIAV